MNAPDLWTDGMQRVLSALYSREPMTDEQRAERRTLIAREYARAEARRQPSPQSDLDLAA